MRIWSSCWRSPKLCFSFTRSVPATTHHLRFKPSTLRCRRNPRRLSQRRSPPVQPNEMEPTSPSISLGFDPRETAVQGQLLLPCPAAAVRPKPQVPKLNPLKASPRVSKKYFQYLIL